MPSTEPRHTIENGWSGCTIAHRVGQPDGVHQVDRERLGELRLGRTGRGGRRVGHHHVEAALAVDDASHEIPNTPDIGDVGHDVVHPVGAELRSDTRQRRRVARADRDPRSLADELGRDRPPDAPAAAGDQDARPFEAEIHRG